jgi:hypothetical protein
MPRGNRRGPWGEGPMTGRGAGYCAGYEAPGRMNPTEGGGRGRGLGWGGGRGCEGGYGMVWPHGWGGRGRASGWGAAEPVWNPGPFYGAPAHSRESEVLMLREQATHVEGVLKEIRSRIAELEKEAGREE